MPDPADPPNPDGAGSSSAGPTASSPHGAPPGSPPTGRIRSIHVSDGGVPKHAIPSAEVLREGLVGDRQHHTRVHGGPTRAVCLLGADALDRLRQEGHPIMPGAVGENLLIEGLDWSEVRPGRYLAFDAGVVLGLLSYARPCNQIAAAFHDGDSQRIDAECHPAEARVYAEVLREGHVRRGESVCLLESYPGAG